MRLNEQLLQILPSARCPVLNKVYTSRGIPKAEGVRRSQRDYTLAF